MNKNVISFMNMKGGVGKTTLCVNLAYCLSKKFNKKILIIDFDPQANATQYLVNEELFENILKEKRTIYQIYKDFEDVCNYSSVYGNEEVDEEDISIKKLICKIGDNLDLMPGSLELVKISQGMESSVVLTLSQYIETNNLKSIYDYIFIDCPPTQSIYTSSALLCSDYYILPVKPDFLSSIGINLFQSIVKKHNKTAPKKVMCLGLVFTMVQGYSYYSETMEKLRKNNMFTAFNEYMQYSSSISKAAEEHKFLYDISNFKPSITKLTEEFLEKIGEKNKR